MALQTTKAWNTKYGEDIDTDNSLISSNSFKKSVLHYNQDKSFVRNLVQFIIYS